MGLKFLHLDLIWPKEVPLEELRPWIINQMNEFGEPVRWAITSITSNDADVSLRKLTVEAVVIISR